MIRVALRLGLAVLVLGMLCMTALAQTPEELAKESEAAAAASATTKPTPEMIIQKVNQACEMLQQKGLAGLRDLQGKDSKFIFAGTYIWVHDMIGNMVMHPIKPGMNNNPLLGFKDPSGKLFFAEMNSVARAKGAGWVDYLWPKPGEKQPSKKISYVKLCKVEGKELVLGCGVYDLSEEQMQKLLK